MAKVLSGGLRAHGVVKKSEPDKPLISVVTVVFNRKEGFTTTLKSIQELNYPNIEYIVIDGGSTDGTLETIIENESSIDYWISEPDHGIYDAMNKGVALGTGSWMNFMNAGDRFSGPDALKLFQENDFAGTDIVYGDAMVEHEGFQTLFSKHPLDQIWKYSPFCHQATFICSSLMKAYKYDTRYKIGADHDVFYRAYMEGRKFRFVNRVICLFDGKDGATRKWILTAMKEKKQIALKYQYSLWKQLYYAVRTASLFLLLLFKRIIGPTLVIRLKRMVKGDHVSSLR